MKAVAGVVISLLVGMGIGWYVARHQGEHKLREAVEEMVSSVESFEAAEAARNARAIGFIDSGEPQSAVRLLCTPIAKYYCTYVYESQSSVNNEQRTKLRSLIESLIATNNTLATAVSNSIANTTSSKRKDI